jgi:peptidyl-prolyl cis-trans isomerase SurA
MNRIHFRRAACAALLSLCCGILFPRRIAAELVDRIVAIVNGHIILQSDWDEGLSYEALLTNRRLADFTDDERRTILDRLIDQELLRQQMKSSDFAHATDTEVGARVAEARKLYPQATSSDAWQSILAQYHLTEKDLITHVREQIDLMRLVDARLRPTVQIDSKSIEAYYREQFVPQLKQQGSREVPLADVSAKIREVLTEKRVNELLLSWLQSLHSEGRVQTPGITSSTTERGVQSQ